MIVLRVCSHTLSAYFPLHSGVNTAAMRASYPQAHMMVTVDCGVLAAAFNPHVGSSHSSVGLTVEEVLEIAFLAGAHPNVSAS